MDDKEFGKKLLKTVLWFGVSAAAGAVGGPLGTMAVMALRVANHTAAHAAGDHIANAHCPHIFDIIG
jgi:hypothetical protein